MNIAKPEQIQKLSSQQSGEEVGLERLKKKLQTYYGVNKFTFQANEIAELCKHPKYFDLASEGLKLSEVIIEGELNLNFAQIDIPLSFINCTFTNNILLKGAKMLTLELKGTKVQSIDATSVHIKGDVELSNSFQASGEVNLNRATIEGRLICTGGKFFGKHALSAIGIDVKGHICLDKGFEARGEVVLNNGTTMGNFACSNGTFEKLTAQKMIIKGNAYLNQDFKAIGEVGLEGTSIDGFLSCDSGSFKEKLSARRMNVKGDVFLNGKFNAAGEVDLEKATICGNLNCYGGSFKEDFLARRIDVSGNVFLTGGFNAAGEVNLYGATIGGALKCNGKFKGKGEKKKAIRAGMIDVKNDVELKQPFNAEGEVTFDGATLNGHLILSGSFKNENENENVLSIARATIKGDVSIDETFCAEGKVVLLAFWWKWYLKIQSESSIKLETFNLWFISLAYHLILKRAGKVSLESTEVGGFLKIAEIKDPSSMFLDLQLAKTRKLEYARKLLETGNKLQLDLNGLIYDSIQPISPIQAANSRTVNISKKLNNSSTILKSLLQPVNDLIRPKLPEDLSLLRLQSSENFSRQPYEQLAKVLKARGDEEDATWVLISKEDDQPKQVKSNCLSWFWKQLLRVSISYGYRPQLSLLWGSIVVIIGAFIFHFGYKGALITPTTDSFTSKPNYFWQKHPSSDTICAIPFSPNHIEQVEQDIKQGCPNYPKFDPFIYSLDVFLPIIDLHLKGYWLPNARINQWGYWLRVYFIIHTILGWAIVTLAVAGFSGLVRRVD